MTNNKKYGNELTLYNVNDIQVIFKCKEKKAYQIMNAKNFPSMRIGREILVTHENLIKYIKQNSTKVVTL